VAGKILKQSVRRQDLKGHISATEPF